MSSNEANDCCPEPSKVKKGSYPSKQQRFGAAPLASFEDLPSDDQQSPDDDNTGEQRFGFENVLDLDSSQLLKKEDNSPTPTPSPTLTITPTGGERKASGSSQNTLTLGRSDSMTPVAEVSNSASFSSIKPESCDKSKEFSKGSHNALLTVTDPNDKSPTPESKRKSSWTDIFFPGRARSKSTSSSPRKSPTERKKSVFAKFISFGKKSPTKDLTSPESQSREMSAMESSDTPRVSVTDTSENEPHEELMIHSPTDGPKASKQDIIGILEAAHSQMDRTPIEDSGQTIPMPLPPLNLRKKLKRRESTIDDDVQSLPEILPSSRSKDLSLMAANDVNTETVVVQIESYTDRDNSSESEVGFDENRLRLKKKSATNDKSVSESEDDFEAQTLLTQDSIDFDETSFSDSFAANVADLMSLQQETIRSPTRKDRLEVQIFPIDRPRSTTPINIVPLEAYIRSTSISPDPNLEKMKLQLPGEQFTTSARAKSPRKSNPSIWFEFCEKGLQSPLQRRKQRANSCFTSLESQQNPFPISPFDAFTANPALTPSPGNLTPITPLEGFGDSKWPGFGDNFVTFESIVSANGVDNTDMCKCEKCECNNDKSSADNSAFETVIPSTTTDMTSISIDESNNTNNNNSVKITDHEYMEDQPLVSPCHCQCHRRADFALTLWKSSSFNKQESISSDISSASSRLIGSSSSNSKCSPTDDLIESINS